MRVTVLVTVLAALHGVPGFVDIARAQQEKPDIVVEGGVGIGALSPVAPGDIERDRLLAVTLVGQVTMPMGAWRVGMELVQSVDRGEVFTRGGFFRIEGSPDANRTFLFRQFISVIAVADVWSVVALKVGTGLARLEYVTPCLCEDAVGQYKTSRSTTVTTLGVSASPRQHGRLRVAPAIDWLLPSGHSGRVLVVSLRLQHAGRRKPTTATR